MIPLLLCVGLFFWGINGYMKFAVAPGESMEIQVTAKQWLWQFEYPGWHAQPSTNCTFP